MADGKLVVRKTFLEVVDEAASADGAATRQHSAPASLRSSLGNSPVKVPEAFELPPPAPSSPDLARGPSVAVAAVATAAAAVATTCSQAGAGVKRGVPGQEQPPRAAQVEREGCTSEGTWQEGMTTIIMRNVPQSYTRAMLLELLDTEGFARRYDFVYLPVEFGSSSAFGYAFVNLITHEAAEHFLAHFQGFTGWQVPSANVADVSWSKAHQGLPQHVERYRNSPMMHESMPDECKPVILRDGVRVPFPAPTKHAPPPRRGERMREAKHRGGANGGTTAPRAPTDGCCAGLRGRAAEPGPLAAGVEAAEPAAPAGWPAASPLFRGLEFVCAEARPPGARPGLFELTTQLIAGSELASDAESSTRLPSSRRSLASSTGSSQRPAAPPGCQRPPAASACARRGSAPAQAPPDAVPTLLAAGLEVTIGAMPPGPPSMRRVSAFAPAARLFSPGTLVEVVGAYPSGERAHILAVDHAEAKYKLRMRNGAVRTVSAQNVHPLS